jgi:chromate transporter
LKPKKPTYREALLFWLKLGFISFGGPAGQIGIMHQFLVDKKKWISNSKFMHALNYCNLLPGPEAQQLATYTGWLLHGTKGGLTAGILFILPSIFILAGLSILYALYGKIPWVYSFFDGLKPAVVAIVVTALLKMSRKSLSSPFHYFIAASAFTAIYFFKVLFPIIILTSIILGYIVVRYFPEFVKSKNEAQSKADEDEYYINANSVIPGKSFSLKRLSIQIIVFILFLLLPVALFGIFSNDFSFWFNMSEFFTKAAFVTFGGAYAVLPYVAQVSVGQFGWLSKGQMIDGFALGETTPGPLIMILAFVGFMGGFNYFGGSVINGITGLLTTTYYTFLPCFLFIFAGAPIIEKTQENKLIRGVLSIVSASVVGVVLNLTLYFGIEVIFPDGIILASIDISSVIWLIASFIALYRFKIDMTLWIAISALYGFVHHYLFG